MSNPPEPQTPEPDLINPVTGDRLWFERLPATPEGTLEFRCQIPPGSKGTPLHLHRTTDERFECIAGALSMCLSRSSNIITLQPGQQLDVPRGTLHRFWNRSASPVTFRSAATPGADFCRFLETVYGLGADKLVGPEGMPTNPLQIAILRELADLYFPGIPMLIQRPVFAGLSLLATAAGTRRKLQRYWKRATPQALSTAPTP